MANMQICANGHYYDGNRYTECPYCKPNMASPADEEPSVTLPADEPAPGPGIKSADENVTVAFDEISGVRPVVGWLVCTAGPEKGRDFRLHANRNKVGRSPDMDVCIGKDERVSRVNHFSVIYDARHDKYFASMGDGQEIVYHNDMPLSPAATLLNGGDTLELGDTTLVFVPFNHKWEEEK